LAKVCQELCQRWIDWNSKNCADPCPFTSEDLKNFSPAQVQEFLAQLLLATPLSVQAVKVMQDKYNFNDIQNAEIKFR